MGVGPRESNAMDLLSFANPVFAAYAVAATLMILLASATSWLTIARMMQVNGGFRSPEDLRKTPLNPNPDPGQLAPNDRVERVRRIQGNNVENIPSFSPPDCFTFSLRRRFSSPASHSTATSSSACFILPLI
jgi:hypothetical protein